jgi:hypothetical protein
MRTWPLFIGTWLFAGAALVVAVRGRSADAHASPAAPATDGAPASPAPTQVVYVVGAGAPSAAPMAAPPKPSVPQAEERPLPATRAEREENARVEREEVIGRLDASGKSNEAWTRGAEDLLSAWGRRPDMKDVSFSALECRHDGCYATATYADDEVMRRADEKLPASDEFQRWSGAKYKSGAEHAPDGSIKATWVFYRSE